MNIGAKNLKPMEQIGLIAVVMVIVLYGYVNAINKAPSRKLARLEQKTTETRKIVTQLQKDQASGRTQRELEKSRRRLAVEKKNLKTAETRLAPRSATDEIGTRILKMASEKGFMIEEYSRISDKKRIQEIFGDNDRYDLSYYYLALRGRFGLIIDLLESVQGISSLVVPRKVMLRMLDDGSLLKTEVWFCM